MQLSKLSTSACLALVAGLANAIPSKGTSTMKARSSEKEARQSFTNGEGTIYLQGGVAGSCGNVNPDSAFIAALSDSFMNFEYESSYCGRQLSVTNMGSNDGVGGQGTSITVTVADTCAACDETHVDFSVGAWNALTNSAPYGTIEIDWSFI